MTQCLGRGWNCQRTGAVRPTLTTPTLILLAGVLACTRARSMRARACVSVCVCARARVHAVMCVCVGGGDHCHHALTPEKQPLHAGMGSFTKRITGLNEKNVIDLNVISIWVSHVS